MSRQKPDERRERLRQRVIEPEALQIRKEIEEWCEDNREQVSALYDSLKHASLSYLGLVPGPNRRYLGTAKEAYRGSGIRGSSG